MAINTILLDFKVDESTKLDSGSNIQTDVQLVLADFVPHLNMHMMQDCGPDGLIIMWSGPRSCLVTLRAFRGPGLVSCCIEYYKAEDEPPLITFEQCRALEARIRVALCGCRSKLLPALRRGAPLDVYMTTSVAANTAACPLSHSPIPHVGSRLGMLQQVSSLESALAAKLSSSRSHKYPALKRGGRVNKYILSSDERILEYDFDDLVFESRSAYQKIQIFHSPTFGNMLVLDDLQNLADSDLVYTETLMQRGKECYEGREVLILGGGDGALLWELLKEKPKFVTMLEIDEVVMSACKEHLRKCCGTCLDSMTGDNYEIIVADCVKLLQQYISSGRTFDYVFGDLTDIPLSSTPQGQVWDFIRLILNKALQVLKPTGKFMTHGNGSSCPKALAMYEEQLNSLDTPVQFSRDHAFVPSFMEDWVFYQVWPKH